jgi:hypothetical protein
VQNISSNADPAITKFTTLFNSVGRLDTSGRLSREVKHQRACIALLNSSPTTTTWHRWSPYLPIGPAVRLREQNCYVVSEWRFQCATEA